MVNINSQKTLEFRKSNRHGTRPPHISYEDDHYNAVLTPPRPRPAADADPLVDCVPCLWRVEEEPSCNWGLGAALKAKVDALRRESETLVENSLASVYQMSYCHPEACVDVDPIQGTAGRCMLNNERREKRAAQGLPCMPDGLIREKRPDTQLEVIAATRFDHAGHSMTSDPCDPCGCELNVGQMVANVRTLKERCDAATEKNIV